MVTQHNSGLLDCEQLKLYVARVKRDNNDHKLQISKLDQDISDLEVELLKNECERENLLLAGQELDKNRTYLMDLSRQRRQLQLENTQKLRQIEQQKFLLQDKKLIEQSLTNPVVSFRESARMFDDVVKESSRSPLRSKSPISSSRRPSDIIPSIGPITKQPSRESLKQPDVLISGKISRVDNNFVKTYTNNALRTNRRNVLRNKTSSSNRFVNKKLATLKSSTSSIGINEFVARSQNLQNKVRPAKQTYQDLCSQQLQRL